MSCQRLRVDIGAELVQQLRRAFHVREEEGDRARGEILPHDPAIIRRMALGVQLAERTRTAEVVISGT